MIDDQDFNTDYDHPPLRMHPSVLQTIIELFSRPTPEPGDSIEKIMYEAGRQSVIDYLIEENKSNVQKQDT